MKRFLYILFFLTITSFLKSYGQDNRTFSISQNNYFAECNSFINENISNFDPFQKSKPHKHPTPKKKKNRIRGVESTPFLLSTIQNQFILTPRLIAFEITFPPQSLYQFRMFFNYEKRGPPSNI